MGKPALDLAEVVRGSSSLSFRGLQAYAGHVQHFRGFDYRRQASEAAMGRAVEVKEKLEKAGFEVPILTGGGTGTYNIDSEVDGVTDVQVGSYLFMDVNYRNVGGKGGPVYDDFRPSLLVLATAMASPRRVASPSTPDTRHSRPTRSLRTRLASQGSPIAGAATSMESWSSGIRAVRAK